MRKEINANDRSVSRLFDDDQSDTYFVPRYQRDFSWKVQHWQQLFDDIKENDPGYFLGLIILIEQSRDNDDFRRLHIVDGQQRIVALSLLYAAIYSKLGQHKGSLNDNQLAEKINLKWRLKPKKMQKNIANQIRLHPQDFSMDKKSDLNAYIAVLDDAISPRESPDGKDSLIIKAYQYFQDRLDKLPPVEGENTKAILELLDKVNRATLVKMDVGSYSDAYTLFESLNNRGLELTGVDIIKSKLFAKLEEKGGADSIEGYSRKWEQLLDCLGDDYNIQERFFRHYYNAFNKPKTTVGSEDDGKQHTNEIATRSNLVRLYEKLIEGCAEEFLHNIMSAGDLYSFIIGRVEHPKLVKPLSDLDHIQGTPSYLLLLYLFWHKEHLDLSDERDGHLYKIINNLVSFFVRRNLTDFPSTNKLARLFMGMVEEIEKNGLTGEDIVNRINNKLKSESSSDETFKNSLEGPVYLENADVVRFILCSLEEKESGREKWPLWRMERKHYIWTIEHIFPQGKDIPPSWIGMMGEGNEAKAKELQKSHVHLLGNLTITGYNSNLGNKSFIEKRDRKDSEGRSVGYRNGLHLNIDLLNGDEWTKARIEERTKRLVAETLDLFPLRNKIEDLANIKSKKYDPMDRFFLDPDSIVIIKKGDEKGKDGKPADVT